MIAPGEQWERLTASSPAPLVDRGPDDPAWLFYTSGTTGRPKGATLTNRNLLMMALSYYADIDPVSPDDSILHVAPLSHGSGLYGLPHIARGAVSVIGDDDRRAASSAGRGCRSSPRPRWSSGWPATRPWRADLSNLKTIIYGGAPMYLADLEDGARALRSAAGPDLRAGRDADDDHRAVEAGPRRRRTRCACRASAPPAPTSRSASSTATTASSRPARSARSWSGATW